VKKVCPEKKSKFAADWSVFEKSFSDWSTAEKPFSDWSVHLVPPFKLEEGPVHFKSLATSAVDEKCARLVQAHS
jgi:hypothetical protein